MSCLLCGFVLSFHYRQITTVASTQDATNDLGEVEIREYEGQDLSSINDSLEKTRLKDHNTSTTKHTD